MQPGLAHKAQEERHKVGAVMIAKYDYMLKLLEPKPHTNKRIMIDVTEETGHYSMLN